MRGIRLALFVGVVVAMSLLATVPALGAPPLPDGGIALEAPAEATATTVNYGDSVGFEYWMNGKTAKNYYLTVRVFCEQGTETVYNAFGRPDVAFPLLDQLVNGTWWDGGDATCTAHLRYFANNRLSVIAETSFDVYAAG